MRDELTHARARYEARPDALEVFLRRRDRRQRARKLGTAVFALAVGLAAIAVVFAIAAVEVPDRGPTGAGTDTAGSGAGKIVFSRWSEGEWHLYSVNEDGSGEQQLTDGARDFYADISPDGTKIVAETELPGIDGLLVMNVDGTDPVTFSLGYANEPSWSPDGSRIAFAMDSGGGTCCLTLWVINADGSGLARLGDVRGSSPTWSPDGSKIAFLMSGERLEDARSLAVMNVDGTDVTPISEPGWWGGTPDWSPDGASILATLDRGLTDGALLTIPADGGEARVIERLPVLGRASWSRDGAQVTYVSKGQVWVMDADGSNTHPVTALGGNVENPTWG